MHSTCSQEHMMGSDTLHCHGRTILLGVQNRWQVVRILPSHFSGHVNFLIRITRDRKMDGKMRTSCRRILHPLQNSLATAVWCSPLARTRDESRHVLPHLARWYLLGDSVPGRLRVTCCKLASGNVSIGSSLAKVFHHLMQRTSWSLSYRKGKS